MSQFTPAHFCAGADICSRAQQYLRSSRDWLNLSRDEAAAEFQARHILLDCDFQAIEQARGLARELDRVYAGTVQ